ncbi:MAG: hypothetical protein JWM91_4445 [Rhodospirillales bacterium]|nr:hypothetical protein [Rhodospirillales bacterium]
MTTVFFVALGAIFLIETILGGVLGWMAVSVSAVTRRCEFRPGASSSRAEARSAD